MIYIVVNGYQGIAYFASSIEEANKFISQKVSRSDGTDCWRQDAWEIFPQKIDAEIQFEIDYG